MQVRDQAALAVCQLACHATAVLELTGRQLYLVETLLRALDLDQPSVGESCCRALGYVLEQLRAQQQLEQQEQQDPLLTNLVVQSFGKLLLVMNSSTAPSQVSITDFYRTNPFGFRRLHGKLLGSKGFIDFV
jgi:hypothetical protein